MSRFFVRNFSFALLLGLAVTSGSASAQYMAVRPGSSFYFNQNTSRGFNGFGHNYNYNFGFRINHVNPVTGQRFTFNWHEGAHNLPPGFLPNSFFNPYNHGAYMNGGYGYNYNNGYNGAWTSGSGQRPYVPYTNSDKGAAVSGQWNYEMGTQKGNEKLTLEVAQLLDPNEDLLLSGQVHNELIVQIRRLDVKGTKVESPLLPAGLTDQIEYTGGTVSAVLTLLKGGKPTYPPALLAPEHMVVKSDLENALNPLLEALLSGKPVNQADAAKMTSTVASAKKKLAETIRNLPLNEGMALTRFLNDMDGIAKTARDPKLAGAYMANWKTVGPSVSEYVKHLDKFSLQIAPAIAGEEDAYATLHRGLAAYFMDLKQQKK
jgi:hypothetical protein